MPNEPPVSFEDAMRLAIAFYCIMEPDKRATIMALAEKYADPSLLADAMRDQSRAFLESGAAWLQPEPTPQKQDRSASARVESQTQALYRQRRYADQLRSLHVSILEDAVLRLPG